MVNFHHIRRALRYVSPFVLRQVAWPTDKMREQQGSRMKCVVTVFGLSL